MGIEKMVNDVIMNDDVETLRTFSAQQLNELDNTESLVMIAIKHNSIKSMKLLLEVGCSFKYYDMISFVKNVDMLKIVIPTLDKSVKYFLTGFGLENAEGTKVFYDNDVRFYKNDILVKFSSAEVFRYTLTKEKEISSSDTDYSYDLCYMLASKPNVYVDYNEKIRCLVEIGSDIYKEHTFRHRYNPINVLSEAISSMNVEFIEFLIEHGADIHYTVSNGNPVTEGLIYYESKHERFVSTLKCLLKHGFDINDKDTNGNTCLLNSMKELHLDDEQMINFFKIMINHGVDIGVKNNSNMGVMHALFKTMSTIDSVEFLIRCNLSINDLDDNGFTPVHYYNYSLLDEESDIDLMKENYESLIDLLIRNHFDFNAGKICLLQKLCMNIKDYYDDDYDVTDKAIFRMNIDIQHKLIELVIKHTSTENIVKILDIGHEIYTGTLLIIEEYNHKRKCRTTKSASN